MGYGLRIFFVDSEDKLNRISQKRFDALMQRASGYTFPDWAGETVRSVEVFVEIENRRPVAIKRMYFSVIPVDKENRLDEARSDQHKELLWRARSPLAATPVATKGSNLLDASAVFAEKEYQREWEWEPTEDLVERLFQTVL